MERAARRPRRGVRRHDHHHGHRDGAGGQGPARSARHLRARRRGAARAAGQAADPSHAAARRGAGRARAVRRGAVLSETDPVAWAARCVGSPVVARRALSGGTTSTLLALTHVDGAATVLRVVDREPWAAHRVALTTREREVQLQLADTPVPAPRSLALDAGAGAHLMTLLPGRVDADRADDASLRALAATLATIHDVRADPPPRTYESWAGPAKHVVPGWAERPEVWRQAFEVLRAGPPAYEPTFLHRDFQPWNVLWDGDRVSGVVDWVETSTGPAWLDVAHCATNLAVLHGLERAEAFAAAYTALTGRPREPYWEVVDTVGFLPPPGGEGWVTDPAERRRFEARLVAAVAAVAAP
ncbi:phosphotransferase [Nocardioides sp. zg-579]|uniref:Phosphotransferase n=1 Tax=Nocardioides marmotae TaxID=2663857 RepID=A0A6I3J0T7_9ACTN|nr:phosphotransferase [Gordonia jinghuaiqii]MTB94601.1 phosphotransferase [Nocardioides marmotae]